MQHMVLVWIAAALTACGSTQHVDAPTTTSATVAGRTAQPVWAPSPQTGSSQMPFDLPATLLREDTDAQTTARILDRVLSDRRLSPRAREVAITTRDHHVMLRGTVETPEERQIIELEALGVAGVTSVDNRIEVVTASP
jgi:osmotically-inducible protein OsmY